MHAVSSDGSPIPKPDGAGDEALLYSVAGSQPARERNCSSTRWNRSAHQVVRAGSG